MLLAHVSDTHIGMTNFGKLNPHSGLHSRLDDFDTSMQRIVEICLEREVDAFLFAGDAYKNSLPSPTYRNIFEKQIKLLLDNKIPVVMITGNHDSTGLYGTSSTMQSFETLLDVIVIDTPQNVILSTKSGSLVVSCMPWPTRRMLFSETPPDCYLNPADVLTKLQASTVQALQHMYRDVESFMFPKVLLAHLDIDQAVYSSEQAMIVKNSLIVPLDILEAFTQYAYIGLGHVHKYQHLGHSPTPIVYSGSIDRIDFSEEHDHKGFCLVTLNDNTVDAIEFCQLPVRDMITITCNLEQSTDPTADLIKTAAQYTYKDAIIRIFYTLDQQSQLSVNTDAVFKALKDAYYIQGVYHLNSKQQRQAVVITEQTPLRIIEEYIEQYPIYQHNKKDLLSLSGDYLKGEKE